MYMGRKIEYHWIGLNNEGKLECKRCESVHNLCLPKPIGEVSSLIRAFQTMHKECKGQFGKHNDTFVKKTK